VPESFVVVVELGIIVVTFQRPITYTTRKTTTHTVSTKMPIKGQRVDALGMVARHLSEHREKPDRAEGKQAMITWKA